MKSSGVAALAAWSVLGGISAGQDIFAIDWGPPSPAYCLSVDGTAQEIGPTGYIFLNSMAKDSNGRIYSIAYSGSCNDLLIRLDPLTGKARTVMPTPLCSVRALAFGPNDELYAMVAPCCDNPFELFELDIATGVASYIGNTGSAIQAMAWGNGKLYGWHVRSFPGPALGLVTIDTTTAAVRDVNPAVGGGVLDVQSLAFDHNGVLHGGWDVLYTVDTTTGILTFVTGMLPTFTTRGFVFPDEYQVAGEQTVRLGTPANPAAFLPDPNGPPAIGETWSPSIDHASFVPGALLDFVTVSPREVNLPSAAGTILCGAPAFLFVHPPGTPFAIDMPLDYTLIGVEFCSQGGSTNASGAVHLANAIDFKIEAF